MKLISFLEGKKTFIIALLIGVVAALQYLNIISNEVGDTLLGLLGAGGLATLRLGVAGIANNKK